MAISHPFVAKVDAIQYDVLDEGPCITAAAIRAPVRTGNVTVNAFSNCPAVRLLINGQAQGVHATAATLTVIVKPKPAAARKRVKSKAHARPGPGRVTRTR